MKKGFFPRDILELLGLCLSAISLFNLSLRLGDVGISSVFFELIQYYRLIADFFFGWLLLRLPEWVPPWLGELWLLSFVIALLMMRGHRMAMAMLVPKPIQRLKKFRVLSSIARICQMLLYGFTFYSLLIAVFGPLLFFLAARYQSRSWWAEVIEADNAGERKRVIDRKLRQGQADDGVMEMFHLMFILINTYLALSLAVIFFAINAYGVSIG